MFTHVEKHPANPIELARPHLLLVIIELCDVSKITQSNDLIHKHMHVACADRAELVRDRPIELKQDGQTFARLTSYRDRYAEK